MSDTSAFEFGVREFLEWSVGFPEAGATRQGNSIEIIDLDASILVRAASGR